MTGVAVDPRGWDTGRPGIPLIELAPFAALAALALGHWARLISDPPVGRALMALALLVGAAALLIALGRARMSSRLVTLAAAAIAVGFTLAALVASGLPVRLLTPGNWGELFDNVGVGLAGIEDSDLPYSGDDVWLRLALLLAAPLLVGIAAALGFWPARRRARLRILALVALVGAYGFAATLDSPGSELAWGLVVLLLAAAWLWLPGMGPRRAVVAAAAAGAAGALALPLAGALDRDQPWWDYEAWDWFGGERRVAYSWDHSYGPLDWPQEGTTLLAVRSRRPQYWKAEVLDRFDGFTWGRAEPGDTEAFAELAGRQAPLGDELYLRHPEWVAEAEFDVRALRSPLVIAPGTTLVVDGLGGVLPAADGTTRAGVPLESGDDYAVTAYAPRPTAAQMRSAPQGYPARARASTAIGLSLSDSPIPGVAPPLWGEPRPALREALRSTSYGGVYALARRLTRDAPTAYDAARAVEAHLRRNYEYATDVPVYGHALPAFLFTDRRGYCQQFSGAMALMLRMVGIPSRIASGFAPGAYDPDARRYEVSDLNAHSWVEVFFRGLGWVPFDPTPSAAPAVATTGSINSLAALLRRGGRAPSDPLAQPNRLEDSPGGRGATPSASADDSGPWAVIGVTGAAIAGTGALGFGLVFTRRRRRLQAGGAAEDQVDELVAALERLGWRVEPGSTLLGLERRFTGIGRRGLARYVEALRRSRFERSRPAPPGPRQRRAMRSALGAHGGLRRRLRALIAIPPGGPAHRTR